MYLPYQSKNCTFLKINFLLIELLHNGGHMKIIFNTTASGYWLIKYLQLLYAVQLCICIWILLINSVYLMSQPYTLRP